MMCAMSGVPAMARMLPVVGVAVMTGMLPVAVMCTVVGVRVVVGVRTVVGVRLMAAVSGVLVVDGRVGRLGRRVWVVGGGARVVVVRVWVDQR